MTSTPPQTWQEHWFEHDQMLHLAGSTDRVALYFDPDMDDDVARWLLPYLDDVWRYTTRTYGDFGPDPLLYTVFHQGRYSGGHPSSYQDASHDHRNVTDCGPGPYRSAESAVPELVTHEISHIVEGANNGALGSPAFPLWRDSKWAEFFIHDVYLALGLTGWAAEVAAKFARTSDAFPRRGTHWFRDWWQPLRSQTGGGPDVMVRFFRLLAQHFPRRADTRYARDLNWGEYLHFTSGAAGGDVSDLARRAFGRNRQWAREMSRAQADFPQISY